MWDFEVVPGGEVRPSWWRTILLVPVCAFLSITSIAFSGLGERAAGEKTVDGLELLLVLLALLLAVLERLSPRIDSALSVGNPELFVFHSNWAKWLAVEDAERAAIKLRSLVRNANVKDELGLTMIEESHPQLFTARVRLGEILRRLKDPESTEVLESAVEFVADYDEVYPKAVRAVALLKAWRQEDART